MDVVDAVKTEHRSFEADVSKLLHMMVHSVYSEKEVFLRELISNAADACERLRYEAIANPALLGEDPSSRIKICLDADKRQIVVEDNGIGMSREEMIEALGTIARSGTKAFLERIQENKDTEATSFIGQFGVGFYSTFMVADRVDVTSRRAGSDEAFRWSSDGKGTFSISAVPTADAPPRGTRVLLHLMEEASSYTQRFALERIVKAQSGHVPVPISLIEKPGAEPALVTDGAALWTRPKSDISEADYTDFYRSIAGQFDDPALTVHFRAEGRQEYTALAFIPGGRPFDLFDVGRKGRIKLYVKRVFITDDAEILPRYLRFVRGLIDSADLPLNISREMVQSSPILAAIGKGVTSRIVSEIEKIAEKEPDAYTKIWENFGTVLKEGIYDDFERKDTLLSLSRFKTTSSGDSWRSLKDYLAAIKQNQTAIYYLTGNDFARLATSPHLEGFRARGVEVLLLADPVDNFWVMSGASFEGKPFKSVTQGSADLGAIPLLDPRQGTSTETDQSITGFIAFMKATLSDAVSDVRPSDRLTDSVACLVAPESGPDRQLEKLLADAGRAGAGAKPILEVNTHHDIVQSAAGLAEGDQEFKKDIAHFFLDEARLLEGDHPGDVKQFSERMARLIRRGLASKSGG
jgi:molecular chaperone HtpG